MKGEIKERTGRGLCATIVLPNRDAVQTREPCPTWSGRLSRWHNLVVSVDESWAIFTSSAIRPKDWDTTRVIVMGESLTALHGHVVRVPINGRDHNPW